MSSLILSQMFPTMGSADTEKYVCIAKYVECQAHDEKSFQLRRSPKP